LAAVLVASITAAGASAATLTQQALHVTGGTIKACGYQSTAGGSQLEMIKVVDTHAVGVKGTFLFSGPGVTETKRLMIGKKGIALISFPVTQPGTETIVVHLPTKPATSGTFHFTLHPLTTDQAAPNGCTPR
jgi:hypothetical protein